MSSKRVAVGAVPVMVAVALVAAAVQSRDVTGPVYTVDQVKFGLAHHPSAWVGRTISVRGGIVLALWPYARLNGPNGLSYMIDSDGCGELSGCTLHLPVGQTLHLFLVPDTGRERPSELEAVRVGLLVQRVYLPVAPYASREYWPNLVLRAQLPRPNALMAIVGQLPFVRSLLPRDQGAIPAGTPRIYRVRLTAPLAFCSQGPVCDDGVLLDRLR